MSNSASKVPEPPAIGSLPKILPPPPRATASTSDTDNKDNKWDKNRASSMPNLALCVSEQPIGQEGNEAAPLPPELMEAEAAPAAIVPVAHEEPAEAMESIPVVQGQPAEEPRPQPVSTMESEPAIAPMPIIELVQASEPNPAPNPEPLPAPEGKPGMDLLKTLKALKAGSLTGEPDASKAKDTKPTGQKEKAPQDTEGSQSPNDTTTISGNSSGITMHADNLDVRKAIELISRQANLNILVSPGVKGTVTADFRNQSVDQALQAIAQLCGLQVRQEKGYLYVTTPAEMRVVEENDLPVRVYRLNYVKSGDVEKMVKPLLSKKGVFTASPDSETGLQSDASKAGAGAKEVKAGGNSLAGGEVVIVQDYENILKTIDRIIQELDIQPIQVLIEAVIVEVKLDKGMELGVNFALLDGAGRALGVAGSGAAINAAAGFLPASVLAAGNTGLVKGGPFDGFAQGDPGLKFGFVDKSTTGFIKALETMGETKILATPRLLVLNKQRAEIHLGKKLGYATSTQTATSTVQTIEFQDVGTQLRLRPYISSDGMIRLEVRPERSSGDVDSDGIPQIDATQVTTNVMVPNGATIVIGGLIESELQDKWSGFPLLSRLPWVGSLFRDTEQDLAKKELIVILTPRICSSRCPQQYNNIGVPNTLGLGARVAQKPAEERRDGPSLYELTRPTTSCPDGRVPCLLTPEETKRLEALEQQQR